MTIGWDFTQTPQDYLLEELLPELHPETIDGAYLDYYSTEQLVDYTYRTEVKTDQIGDGNCLVPRDVGGFEDARFSNPPAHIASVLVPEDSLGGTLSFQFDGFAGQYLTAEYPSYYNHPTNESFLSAMVSGEVYELYQDDQPYHTTTPPVKFQISSDPITLSESTEYHQEIELPREEIHLVSHNTDTDQTSVRILDEERNPVGSIDDWDSDTVDIYHVRPSLELTFEVSVETEISDSLTDGLPGEYVLVQFLVRNETTVSEDEQQEWHERRVFYPSAEFEFEDTEVVFPPQQHDVSLEQALNASGTDEDETSFDNTYRQQDCFLTRVVDSFDERWNERNTVLSDPCFRTTSFGIYDYIEEEPINAAYRLDELVQMSDAELAGAMSHIGDRASELERDEALLRDIRGVLLTLRHYLEPELPAINSSDYDSDNPSNNEPTLRKFQWDAIQERIEVLLDNETSPLVVQAPTSAGKTIVYYASTLLSIFHRDTRAAFPFPTRMLTEDKLEEVIDLGYAYHAYVRDHDYPDLGSLPAHEFTIGVALGKQYSDYGPSNYLHTTDLVSYIGDCHSCGGSLRTICVDCDSIGQACSDSRDDHRHNVQCADCGFEYDFVFDTKRTPQYLPSLTVGTPEKFFTMPTIETQTDHSTRSTLPFYGAPYHECEECGRALTDMNTYRVTNNREGLTCIICLNNNNTRNPFNEVNWSIKEPYSQTAEHDPIGHLVLDETHMYTGQFGITISVIIRFFEVLASRLRAGEDRDRAEWSISADSGTATISNKLEHISRLLSTSDESIRAVPGRGEHGEYFESNLDRVRYRILAGTPVGTSNRESFRQAVVRTYDDLHNNDSGTEFRNEFDQTINDVSSEISIDDYELLLGYLFRKADGYALQETIADLAEEVSDGQLTDIPFLSGDSSKSDLRGIFGRGNAASQNIVLANLVVSLGIDIPELNNLILFGAPRSMSEQMQTIGRTGRDEAAGHANIHLYPGKPRDMQIQRNFHTILSEIDDYYDRAAIQPTNPHIADILFDYVLAPFITLEFAIREDPVYDNELHIVQDLHAMFDTSQSPTENQHVLALYRDLQEIFCPSDLDLDEAHQELLEDQVLDQLLDYVGDDTTPSVWQNEARRNSADSRTVNINSWFSKHAGDLELRGVSGTSLTLTTEWTTESEVDE